LSLAVTSGNHKSLDLAMKLKCLLTSLPHSNRRQSFKFPGDHKLCLLFCLHILPVFRSSSTEAKC